MSISSFGVRRPVVVNLYVFGLLAAGVIFGAGIQREFFPAIDPTMVVVTAPYPGASPEEVEESLAIKIEDRLSDLRDIKEITTIATEGAATVRIEFEEGVNIDKKVAEVKREVDALQDLPERVERIIVDDYEPNIPVISLNLFGSAHERVMKDAILRMRDDLRSLPGMGDVLIAGLRGDELAVEVRPEALLKHGVSIPAVADRIRQGMMELPGGAVRTPGASVTIRTMGAEERADAVRRIVVKAGGAGQVVRVEDVGDVVHGFVDADITTRFNGHPVMGLTIYKVGKDDAVEMADMVKAYRAGRLREPFTPTLGERISLGMRRPGDGSPVSRRMRAYQLGLSRADPPPGDLAISSDLSRFIVQRLQLLVRNASTGAFFVFLALMLLLNWRSSFWVVLGLVVAVFGTLVAMRLFGITLNLLTMFGLIVVVGMLVDDGIVIAENISTRHARGEPPMDAAIKGAEELTWPVFGTVITTVFAFLPLMLIQGRMGDMLGALPLVVACALGVSLVEALLSLPKHMGHSMERSDARHREGRTSGYDRLEERFDSLRDRCVERAINRPYGAALGSCLRRPWLTLVFVTAATIASIGMVAGGRLPFVFFDAADTETLVADLRMPIGTPLEATDAILRRIEAAALAQPEVRSVFVLGGAVADLEAPGGAAFGHMGQLFIELHPVEERQDRAQRTGDEVKVAIREAAGELPGIRNLRISGIEGGPSGPAISLAVTGESATGIASVVAWLQERLRAFDGVYDVGDDADSGQREVRLSLRAGASELGFTVESVARQIRGAVFGLEAHTFPGELEDVDVRVRLPEATRRSVAAIERMHVFTPEGTPVPLAEVVNVEESLGYATVRRLNGHRAVTVSADVDNAVTSPEAVTRELWPEIRDRLAQSPGIRILERGRQKDMKEAFATLPLGFLVALGLNYAVLAWLCGSYIQPLIIMTAIPFSIVGVIWGHIAMGYNLTFLSLIGFVALSGVVVNNAIVYMEFYNIRRAQGVGPLEAALESGRRRLRPILLTTITTIAGLGPMVLERSFQATILIPMAITICWGLLFSTILVLLALPCLLVVLDQLQRIARAAWHGEWTPCEPPRADAAALGDGTAADA